MASGAQSKVFGFTGGYVTDLPDQARKLAYFLKAENVIYEVDGGIHKFGGTEPLFQLVFNGIPSINGMFDYWLGGGADSFTQNFILVTSAGEIYKDNFDGSATNITGTLSLGADPIPVFCVARDILTIWFSTNVAPAKYTGSGNATALGGSPPAGRGGCFHVNRMFTWGVRANPSRLYYSSSASIEDWSGADTGSIDVDPDDGDEIIGVVSFRGNLIIFKGPNKGSVHVLSGTAPTGANAFAKAPLSRGLPLQTHNSIVHVGNDIFFMSNRGVHSLSATQAFGNFTGADESRFLKKFFREQINKTVLNRVWGVDYSEKSSVIWAMAGNGQSNNNIALGFSYVRQQEEGASKVFVINRSCESAAIRKHPSTKVDELIFGGNNGTVQRQDTSSRSENEFLADGFTLDVDQLDLDYLGGSYASRAYSMRIQTPQLLLQETDANGSPRGDQPFSLENFWLRTASVGDHNITIALTRDSNAPETYTFNQGQAGFELDVSHLDAGTLGGVQMRLVYSDPPVTGEARTVQFDIIQGGLNEDAHIFEMGIDLLPTAATTESL